MIRDVLREELVNVEIEASTWRDVVRHGGYLLVKEGKIDMPFIDSMIETVEELGPYMILLPDVAFFHGKPSSSVKEACLSFVTLKNDVYFDDFDNQRIKCAFAFGAVDSESHMQMLMSVASLLQDQEFINLVCEHGSKEKIMKKIQQY